MSIDIEDLSENCRLVRVQGRLDAHGVDKVDTMFNVAVANGKHHAIVDLTGVDFVASLGLRMFIAAVRGGLRHGKKVVFFGVQPAVRQVLDHSAFEKIAPLAGDLAAARALVE
jgi:anti-anti-sigma factor